MARVTQSDAVIGYFRKYPFAPRYRGAKRLTLRARDGLRLSATALGGPTDAPAVVVLLHGFVNWSRTPKLHAFATMLSQHVPVVVPDLRGHGRSSGRCTFGRDEVLDVEASVAAARELAPGLPVVTIGVSLGGAASVVHAAEVGGVAAVVAVSAPAWWEQADGDGSKRVVRWISTRHGRAVLATLLRTRIARECDGRFDPVARVGDIADAVTIVVHDHDDWYFGPEHAEALYAAAPEPRELWWCDGQGHGSDLLTPALADRLLTTLAGLRDSSGRSATTTASPDVSGQA